MTPSQSFHSGRVALWAGDSLDVLRGLEANSIDAVVTDPPYALVSIQKRFGKPGSAPAQEGRDGLYKRASAGFMGKQWDTGERAFAAEFWAEVLRVLKPGGHVAAFGGTRTVHRLAVAIEDAGFEIRDQVQWLYGSGFPKSLDVSKAIDKKLGVKGSFGDFKSERHAPLAAVGHVNHDNAVAMADRPWVDDPEAVDRNARVYQPGSPEAAEWEGFGTALKPACEPIVLARKALAGTVAENVLEHGVGGLNIDGCRIETAERWLASGDDAGRDRGVALGPLLNNPGRSGSNAGGRWPANVVHDGSDEVLAGFPDSAGQQGDVTGQEPSAKINTVFSGKFNGRPATIARGDSGSAARFFYTAKADAEDRIGSKHPTVKPVDLMRWLCRLIAPPSRMVAGVVQRPVILDPFAGTGTTAEAAFLEGFAAVLIEREADYRADIARRMELMLAGPATKRAESLKARHAGRAEDHGPLFGGADEAIGGGQTCLR